MIKLIKSTFYHERDTQKKLATFISKAELLSFGKECQKFERQFSKWQEAKHSVMVNSGSSANLAILQTLLNLGMLKKGDYVGYSAVTWSTNVMPLLQLGLQPVPIDVSLDHLNVTAVSLLAALQWFNLKAVFLTNLLGMCGDIDEIATICQSKKIILIEDNCESMGTVYKKKKLGNYGIAGTFSFYVGHHMSTVEGGAVVTGSSTIAEMLHLVRAHGWDRNLSFAKQDKLRKKYNVNSSFYSRYTFYDLGYNLRPTEIAGYLGQIQLPYMNEIIKKRQANYRYLSKIIFKNSEFYPLTTNHLDVHSNFAFPLICRSVSLRDRIVELCNNKVEIRPVVGGNMLKQPFMRKYSTVSGYCVNAATIHEQGLYFGNNPELTQKELHFLAQLFSRASL